MKKILLIEDNEDHAELIKQVLQQAHESIAVCTVNRIQKAVQLLKNESFDLILSDYYIPDAQGESYIQNLNTIAPLTPIVIISGKGDEETAAKSIQAGAEDYIVKTREALQALPKILKRIWTKHQRNWLQRKKEIKQNKEKQKKLAEQILEEFKKLEEQLQNQSIDQKQFNKLVMNSDKTLSHEQIKLIRLKLEQFVSYLERIP